MFHTQEKSEEYFNHNPNTPTNTHTMQSFRFTPMATPEDQTDGKIKKKLPDFNVRRRKLIFNADVEVRSMEDGFLGSWHVGKVTGFGYGRRLVKYQDILSDNGNGFLAEWINVSPVIDGILQNNQVEQHNYRGNIRPLPHSIKSQPWSFHYGQCVDVFFQDAWWEGVIFDHEDGSAERNVFFPDMGDEMKFQIEKMRITQEWDEVTEQWKPRGAWLFLELVEELEQAWPVLVSVKQIWYDLRVKQGFQNLREWTSAARDIWKDLLLQVQCDNFKLTVNHLFHELNTSGDLLKEGYSLLPFSQSAMDSILKLEAFCGDNLAAIVPYATNDSPPLSSLHPHQHDIFNEEHTAMSLKNPNRGHKSARSTHKLQWLPAGQEIVPGAEFCPEAIALYNGMVKCGQKGQRDVIPKVRKHLAALDWKLEYVRDGRSIRMRYTSPSGDVYYSLRNVCQVLTQAIERQSAGATDIVVPSPLIEKPQRCQQECLFSGCELATNESDICPEAVVNYFLLGQDEEMKRVRNERVNNIALKALKHLCAIGWRLDIRFKKGKKEKVYNSPTGKPFYSLRTACEWCVTKGGLSSNTSGVGNFKLDAGMCHEQSKVSSLKEYIRMDEIKVNRAQRKRRHSTQPPSSDLVKLCTQEDQSSFLEEFKEDQDLKKQRKDSNAEYSTRVLRLNKRARPAGSSSTYQNPRTILSWLIDANVVLPRAKVQYLCRKDRHPMKEGRITREGIKCICCQKIFTLSKFEAHAGSKCHRPSENIFLEDGRSLMECQWQLKRENNAKDTISGVHKTKDKRCHANDYICSICHDGGELVLCDRCPSSFHTSCLGFKEVPDGDWFCSSCCCGICGLSRFDEDTEQLTEHSIVNCVQCERKYHIQCLRNKGHLGLDNCPEENWCCSEGCQQIYLGLQELLGKQIPVGLDNLTWTLLKYTKASSDNEHLVESYSKLNVALSVMHECFEPVKEHRTRRDLVEDVIFSRWSDLNRLNFQGFYTVLLERDDELITVATVRVYGNKVAEMPLIATRFQYRRQGMCRILMDELEKKLIEFGVERLVLPAVPSVLDTWTNSFGFSTMKEAERLNFLDYTFLDFQGTVMCQKRLKNTSYTEFTQPTGNSSISEVFQADQTKDTDIVDQGSARGGTGAAGGNSSAPSVMENGINPENFQAVNHNESEEKTISLIKCYKRRKTSACAS